MCSSSPLLNKNIWSACEVPPLRYDSTVLLNQNLCVDPLGSFFKTSTIFVRRPAEPLHINLWEGGGASGSWTTPPPSQSSRRSTAGALDGGIRRSSSYSHLDNKRCL